MEGPLGRGPTRAASGSLRDPRGRALKDRKKITKTLESYSEDIVKIKTVINKGAGQSRGQGVGTPTQKVVSSNSNIP